MAVPPPAEVPRTGLSAEQAAAVLGVRLQTVYSYVSRGRLSRVRSVDAHGRRVSAFDRGQVQALAAARHEPAQVLDPSLDTVVTLLTPDGRLRYRGFDVVALAGSTPFEDVAELVWGAIREPGAARRPWRLAQVVTQAVREASGALPDAADDGDRMRAALVALRAASPSGTDRSAAPVQECGRRAVLAALSGLPVRTAARAGPSSVAQLLWSGIGRRPPRPGELAVVDAALVLLADHELAASTRAVRLAAQTLADPYLVLLTGLAAVGGSLHGASSRHAEALVRAELQGEQASGRVAGARVTPGFGHAVYTGTDPRADRLLELLEPLAPEVCAAVGALALREARRTGLAPNVDLALGALVVSLDLHPGSGQTIFALGRLAGWTAHAIEAYPAGLRHRPRAVYSGRPAPG